jgi:uncharacterized phage protein (TIGR01671 family)
MDREILFRAKRVADEGWEYGLPSYDKDYTYTYIESNSAYHISFVDVYPETLGQFTGFLDKDKKKIFEGDILEVFYDDLFPENSVKYTVLFHNGAWCIKEDNQGEIERLEKFDCDRGIVVGNIYDNKEE